MKDVFIEWFVKKCMLEKLNRNTLNFLGSDLVTKYLIPEWDCSLTGNYYVGNFNKRIHTNLYCIILISYLGQPT